MSKKKKRDFQRPMRPLPFNKGEGDKSADLPPGDAPMRLNKYIAHAGICSRREAAVLVKKGEIKVNGEVQKEPGYLVQSTDKVLYNEAPIRPAEKLVYLLMNKPKDTATTEQTNKNRGTVLDIIGDKVKEKVYPVGYLDPAATGLLLLTNDKSLAEKLSRPAQEITKFYQVTTDKPVSAQHLADIRAGLTLTDGTAVTDSVDFVKNGKPNEIGIGLRSGRKDLVQRIFQHLGYEAVKLDRVYYAGLTKKDLPRGWFRHLTEKEVIMLKHFI